MKWNYSVPLTFRGGVVGCEFCWKSWKSKNPIFRCDPWTLATFCTNLRHSSKWV